MKIAYNPKSGAALQTAPDNNDITFDLAGKIIYARGEGFKGTDTTYDIFRKASESVGGYNGLVPAPNYNSNSKNRFLKEDGTWVIPDAGTFDGMDSDRFVTTHNISEADTDKRSINVRFEPKWTDTNSSSYILRVGSSTEGLPDNNCGDGNLLHIQGRFSDTAFLLLSGWYNNSLYFRSGNEVDGVDNTTKEEADTGLFKNAWNRIPFFTDLIALNIKLTGYLFDANNFESITSNDTVSSALSKLECKTLFVYSWLTSDADDTDEKINKWHEVEHFLERIEETTLNSILNTKADKETTIQDYGLWEKYTDLNEAPMGAFFCGGESVTNSPESGHYISGLTLAKDKNAQFRTQLGFVENRVFTRQENGANNWSQWRELAFLGDVAKKATTLAGYGITDAVPFLNMVNASNLKSIGVGYVNANGANGENGGIISFGSVSHQTQIHSDHSGGNIHWRVNNNGTLTNWKNLLDSNNYSKYAVTLDTAQTITGEKIFQQGTGKIPLRIRNTTDFAFIQAGSSGTNNTASLAISGLNVSNLTSLQVYSTSTAFHGNINIKGVLSSDSVSTINTSGYSQYIKSLGRTDMITGTTKPGYPGISMVEAYGNNTGYPVTYGNIILVLGITASGAGLLCLGWTGTDVIGNIYYRSLRDLTNSWSEWKQLAFIDNIIPYLETSEEIKKSAIGYGYPNAGFASAGGFISAIHHGGKYGFQLNATNTGSDIWYRGLNNGTFTTWRKLAFSDGEWNRVLPYYYENPTTYYYWFKIAQVNISKTNSQLAEIELISSGDANYGTAASGKIVVKRYYASANNSSISINFVGNPCYGIDLLIALSKDGSIWAKAQGALWSSYLRWRASMIDEYYPGITILDGSTKQIDQPNDSYVIRLNTYVTYRISTDAFEAEGLSYNIPGYLGVNFINASNDISTTGWFINKLLNEGLYNEAGGQRWYYRSDDAQKGWYSTTDIIAAKQLVSVLGEGTAPLKVYSTTMVDNLHSQYASNLKCDNARDVNEDPYGYGAGSVNWRFKRAKAIGLATNDYEYAGVLHLTPWNDSTGGPDHQLAFESNGKIKYRSGLSTWSDWKKVVFTEGTDNLKITNSSARTTYVKDSTHSMFFGYSDGSYNRGLYDNSLSNWIMYTDSSNQTFINQWLGNVGIKTGNTTLTAALQVGGSILASGDITAYSDRRLKSNIQTLENRGYVEPVTFEKDGKQCIGFIAQDVEEKYPELVNSEGEYLSLNYQQYTAVLQALIIELDKRIKELENGFSKL